MAKDVDNARVYGDINSAVFVGAKGSTAPITPTVAPGTPFAEVGWLSEDGITEARAIDSAQKRAWQGGALVRTVKSSDSRSFKFVMLETNAITMGLVRPGATVTTATGITHTLVKAHTGQDRRAWILDTIDGEINVRKIVADGEITEIGDVVYKGTEITGYEVTVTCYPDSTGTLYEEYSDDPAVAVVP